MKGRGFWKLVCNRTELNVPIAPNERENSNQRRCYNSSCKFAYISTALQYRRRGMCSEANFQSSLKAIQIWSRKCKNRECYLRCSRICYRNGKFQLPSQGERWKFNVLSDYGKRYYWDFLQQSKVFKMLGWQNRRQHFILQVETTQCFPILNTSCKQKACKVKTSLS